MLWEVKSEIGRDQLIKIPCSNSDQKPAVNRYGGPRRDQKRRGDKEGRDGIESCE